MRPIDADKFQEFIRENCADSLVELWCELVRRQPTIEAVPVVHGEWLKVQEWATKAKFRCSVCGREIMSATKVNTDKYPYCHCGAKMEGSSE